MQRLQDLFAPGEEGIARQGNQPVRGERSQTGFQEMAGFLVIQVQVPGQFEHHRLTAGRKKVSLFPPDDSAAMHPHGLSKLLLCEVPASAQGFEQRAGRERDRMSVPAISLPSFWRRSFCPKCSHFLRHPLRPYTLGTVFKGKHSQLTSPDMKGDTMSKRKRFFLWGMGSALLLAASAVSLAHGLKNRHMQRPRSPYNFAAQPCQFHIHNETGTCPTAASYGPFSQGAAQPNL